MFKRLFQKEIAASILFSKREHVLFNYSLSKSANAALILASRLAMLVFLYLFDTRLITPEMFNNQLNSNQDHWEAMIR